MVEKARVIIDTNIWISFLIGKKLKNLDKAIANQEVIVITSDQLIEEIKLVTSRPKIKKYFKRRHVNEFLTLLKLIGENHTIKHIPTICRDPKDNFLLGLIEVSKANYLVTGDNDLLDIKFYKGANIVTFQEFNEIINR